jgi:hypothetical protein
MERAQGARQIIKQLDSSFHLSTFPERSSESASNPMKGIIVVLLQLAPCGIDDYIAWFF